jgi:hypothetical protein
MVLGRLKVYETGTWHYTGYGFSGYSGFGGYSGYSGPGGADGTVLVAAAITGSPTTLTYTQCNAYAHYITNAAATTVNLPAVSTVANGAFFLIYAKTAYVVTVDPNAADRIILNGTVQSDGVTVYSSGVAGDYISFHKDGVDGWTIVGRSGVWSTGT